MIKTSQPALHGVQHLPDGSDPIPGFPAVPAGDSVLDLILTATPSAFWKLNETTGTTGFDSSGNGYDITSAGGTPPTWGQPAGPPGDVTADFTGAHWLIRTSFPAFGTSSADMTALGWLYYTDSDPSDVYTLVGQGAGAGAAFGTGWQVAVVGGSGGHPKHLLLYVADGAHAGNEVIYSNNPLDENTWYAWAVVHDAGTWKMYINGLLQASTSTRTNTGVTGVYVGGDPANIATFHLDGRESYVAIYPTALSGADLLAIYEAGTTSGLLASGLVWTTDGAGGASWQLATIEVDY